MASCQDVSLAKSGCPKFDGQIGMVGADIWISFLLAGVLLFSTPWTAGASANPAQMSSQHTADSTVIVGDDWSPFNESQLTPLLPWEIVWLLEEAQDRLRNRSHLPLALEMARTMARYTSVVYCKDENIMAWNCSRCNERAAAFSTFSTIEDAAWDLKAYTGWSPSLPGIVVAFRGTDSHSVGNWVENMRYWRTDFKVPYPGADGSKVHTGFFSSYNFSNLQPNVSTAVGAMLEQHPGADVYIMGHSMGAAVATICAIDVKFTFDLPRERVHLYTFGSPRVGNDVFARFVSTQIRDSIRVTHNRDIVPAWPPMWVGFHHLPTEIWVIDIGFAHVVGVCDDTGEDPMCHNSVCFLGFCTSIADHLLYMGEIMGRGYPEC
ncbi:hypothetical protein WJX73_010249 [Symbiochloris irregularis]|uniref:Fungal lipase-type domain-containing protein n=1 Tax=Symbiochloris irregularis TaxID=706552 RepID=A0AAW1PFG3_9CHLO